MGSLVNFITMFVVLSLRMQSQFDDRFVGKTFDL